MIKCFFQVPIKYLRDKSATPTSKNVYFEKACF